MNLNTPNLLVEILRSLLIQSPMLLVSLVGILVAILGWGRAPAASLWTLLAFCLALLLCLLIPLGHHLTWRLLAESDAGARATANTVLGVVWTFLRAGSYLLLLVGVYAGRQSATAAQPAPASGV